MAVIELRVVQVTDFMTEIVKLPWVRILSAAVP